MTGFVPAMRRRRAQLQQSVDAAGTQGSGSLHLQAHDEGLDSGERFQVKRIMVKPGSKLSLQMHHHRAEHWVVVSGTARVVRGEETLLLSENQSTYIPLGTKHRLENVGKVPLHMIEVQSGGYLGEDDIVRLEDDYKRQ